MKPTWGYSADGSAQIFNLADGEGLPDGWADTPATFEASEAPAGDEQSTIDGKPAPAKRRGRPPKEVTP